MIYQRLEPVFVVLDHIYTLACETEKLDEDLDTIFEIGFNYLNAQFNVIKIYFESLFQSNCDDFVHYSEMLLFLSFIWGSSFILMKKAGRHVRVPFHCHFETSGK